MRAEREVICPTCEGDGMVLVKDPARREHAEPCPECMGACVVYCCEGERADSLVNKYSKA